MGEENRISTDRASRSRSRTPFLRSSCDRELCNSGGGAVHSHSFQIQYQETLTAVAESQHDGKTFSFKYSDTAFGTESATGEPRALRKKKDASGKSLISHVKGLHQINGVYRNSKGRNTHTAVNKTELKSLTDGKTSDYSSEGESKLQDSQTAFQLYKQSGDWWNVFPKTDYTYSEYSPYRKEIAPGIVNMPNMSRLGLHNPDFTSPTHNVMQQAVMQKFTSTSERSRYSSNNSKSGGDRYDPKWARVLGAEYATNESFRRDDSSSDDTRVLTKILTVIYSFVYCCTLWISRSVSFSHSDNINSGYTNSNASSLTFKDQILQWIYRGLGYVKLVDTWLLLGWSKESYSTNSGACDSRTQSLCLKLVKIFIIFLPTLLVAGCWAYVQTWDDKGVSNSVSIPEPNEPLLTSHLKSTSGSVIQDFGLFSPLKFLTSSFASNLHMLWMWIIYPLTRNTEMENNPMVQNVMMPPPAIIIDSSQQIKNKIEDCSPSQVNLNDLVPKIIMSPLFVNYLSSLKEDGGESSFKIDNIESKLNLLQQQLNQKTTEIEILKNMVKSEVKLHVNAISKDSKEDANAIWAKLDKLGLQMDEVNTQHHSLENLILIERSSSEKSILELKEMLTRLREEYSVQPSLQVTNELNLDENFNNFKLELMKYVDDQFNKYDADKTGLPDYALESSGGSIVSTRCTETYQAKTAVFSLFGIPLWSPSINPRKIIQPGILPGECWAFKGSQGYVVIKLSKKVHITRFSLEHTPKSLSPVGTIDSAPRNFSVWGLESEIDTESQLFGQYMYDQNGPSLQYFPVEKLNLPPYQFIELRIESNHGNLEYTCVYRFRVHGNVHKNENEIFGQHGN